MHAESKEKKIRIFFLKGETYCFYLNLMQFKKCVLDFFNEHNWTLELPHRNDHRIRTFKQQNLEEC